MRKSRIAEYVVACASFVAACVFAFASLNLSEEHEVAAGNCTVIAQFLLLTASIFGIDYKLNNVKNGFTQHAESEIPRRTERL